MYSIYSLLLDLFYMGFIIEAYGLSDGRCRLVSMGVLPAYYPTSYWLEQYLSYGNLLHNSYTKSY